MDKNFRYPLIKFRTNFLQCVVIWSTVSTTYRIPFPFICSTCKSPEIVDPSEFAEYAGAGELFTAARKTSEYHAKGDEEEIKRSEKRRR